MAGEGARYTRVAMWLHWGIGALILANLSIGLLRGSSPGFRALMPAHKAIGLTVLALTLVRLGWRLANPPPPLPAGVTRWQRLGSDVVHWTLYALSLAMPVTGWLLVSGAQRRPLEWFGLFPLPYLPVSPATAGAGASAHLVLGWTMLTLLAAHVGAALYHWQALGDGVMRRIAPPLEPETAELTFSTGSGKSAQRG